MSGLVIDASLAAAWCFPEERTEYANGVLQAVSNSLAGSAPRLWAYEIRNAVLMGLRRGRIDRADAEGFLESLADLNIHLFDPVWYDALINLAEVNSLTVYDAAYLDLAIREGSQLASLDTDLQKAAVKSGVVLFDLSKSY
jgi:predicted nucleic acid-binding protein